MNRQDIVNSLLEGRGAEPAGHGSAFAPANIALCKYWGKRDETLNLPVTSSLSISLGQLGTLTTVAAAEKDTVLLNGNEVPAKDPFFERLASYLDLFRTDAVPAFRVDTNNNIPTAAGLASSASGFAALILALNAFFDWHLGWKELSILARLGSGSASRSIHTGFVEWHAGSSDDGLDSFAEPLDETWPSLRVGLVKVSEAAKAVGSRSGMKRTQETSALYEAWPVKVAHDLMQIKAAIRDHDFDRLGRSAESNALAMHATMAAAWPPLVYWQPGTLETMHRTWELREQGTRVYLTMDAGPNVKLLFMEDSRPEILRAFPKIEIVAPFGE